MWGVTHENLEKDSIRCARLNNSNDYRLFYIYGGTAMKDYEIPFYENYCKRCISGDTCLELTEFEEAIKEDDIVKEFNKLFYHEIRTDCWTYSCEQRDCCECRAYQDAFEEYKNERQKA